MPAKLYGLPRTYWKHERPSEPWPFASKADKPITGAQYAHQRTKHLMRPASDYGPVASRALADPAHTGWTRQPILTPEIAMTERTYTISDGVFAKFPDYVRGVVVAYDLRNGSSTPELVEQLRAAEADLRSRMSSETIPEHPRIASWRAAFKALGIKPNEFRCSVEAMARRALRGQELPAINALVDIGNILSLRHVVPVGSHAIDVVRGNLSLRLAKGTEVFTPFGSDQEEHPLPGEIIFAEDDTVLVRRWSWRQANHSLTLPETTAIEFNVDGLAPVMRADVETICREVVDMIQHHCGGTMRCGVLSRESPTLSLER